MSNPDDVLKFLEEIQGLVAYYAREYQMNYPSMIGAMILWHAPTVGTIKADENVRRFTTDLTEKIHLYLTQDKITFHEAIGTVCLVRDQVSADLREKGDRGF